MKRAISALLDQDQNTRPSARRFLDWYASAREYIREVETDGRGGKGEDRSVVQGRGYEHEERGSHPIHHGAPKHSSDMHRKDDRDVARRDDRHHADDCSRDRDMAPHDMRNHRSEGVRGADQEKDLGSAERRDRARHVWAGESHDDTMIFPASPRGAEGRLRENARERNSQEQRRDERVWQMREQKGRSGKEDREWERKQNAADAARHAEGLQGKALDAASNVRDKQVNGGKVDVSDLAIAQKHDAVVHSL